MQSLKIKYPLDSQQKAQDVSQEKVEFKTLTYCINVFIV